jgi:hypothetical protein
MFTASACGGDSSSPNGDGDGTVTDRPSGVPAGAAPVDESLELGRIERRAAGAPETEDIRTLEGASCSDGVAVLETSHETIYGALPCDKFLDEETAPVFVEKELALRFEPSGDGVVLYLETVDLAQAQFTLEGAWIE